MAQRRVAKRVISKLGTVSTPTLTTVMMRDHQLHNQSVRDVWPCNPECARFAGPAYTIRYLPIREDLRPVQLLDHPKNLMRPSVESVPAGAVLVLDANQRNDVGMLGGNLAMRLHRRGVAAVVTDGGMRDIPEIREIGLPMFVSASAAPPSFASLMIADTQVAIACGGVTIFPGDIVVGDAEGVVAVPAHMAAEVAEAGWAMEHLESYVHQRLATGEALPGLYPPGDRVRKDYNDWVKAGEPPVKSRRSK